MYIVGGNWAEKISEAEKQRSGICFSASLERRSREVEWSFRFGEAEMQRSGITMPLRLSREAEKPKTNSASTEQRSREAE